MLCHSIKKVTTENNPDLIHLTQTGYNSTTPIAKESSYRLWDKLEKELD
jgi:hypothetical protein